MTCPHRPPIIQFQMDTVSWKTLHLSYKLTCIVGRHIENAVCFYRRIWPTVIERQRAAHQPRIIQFQMDTVSWKMFHLSYKWTRIVGQYIVNAACVYRRIWPTVIESQCDAHLPRSIHIASALIRVIGAAITLGCWIDGGGSLPRHPEIATSRWPGIYSNEICHQVLT